MEQMARKCQKLLNHLSFLILSYIFAIKKSMRRKSAISPAAGCLENTLLLDNDTNFETILWQLKKASEG